MESFKINNILSQESFHFDPLDERFNYLVKKIQDEKNTMLEKIRLYYIWQSLKNVKNIDGDTCEIGVYKGGTSKFISLAKEHFSDNSLHFSIDTFEGHGKESITEHDIHSIENFSDIKFTDVSKYLSNLNIKVIKENITNIKRDNPLFDRKLKFVHLDTDLFKPTKFFLLEHYDRLAQNGIIIIDDFNTKKCPGILKAFKSFVKHSKLKNINIFYYYLPSSQLIIIKS